MTHARTGGGVVRIDPTVSLSASSLRLPGTYVPGLITAGTYYDGRRREFWDVVRPQLPVVVELADTQYDRLVVGVADPVAVVRQLRTACRLPPT